MSAQENGSPSPPPASAGEPVISVRDVAKMYRLFNKPQDRLKNMLFYRFGKRYGREFWALQGITFDVQKGETVGIIGRNGSGKSTLLQIIAGTLEPTMGNVQVRGRVAALLELGSGFNAEYTGRENVYMNGAILGLTRDEMDQRFDDIAAFADIGEFIEQPVKTYSSGMLVRLAFAVQAYVPKEVLIVDEALSVGDMFFSAKCMRRMKQMMDEGVTVLFVSHDTGAVKSLCQRAILLDKGRMAAAGRAGEVAENYFRSTVTTVQNAPQQSNNEGSLAAVAGSQSDAFRPSEAFLKRASFQRVQTGRARFANVQLLDSAGREVSQLAYNQEVTLRTSVEICEDVSGQVGCGYHIRNQNGIDVAYSDSVIEDRLVTSPRRGSRYVFDWVVRLPLMHGQYSIATVLSVVQDPSQGAVEFCDFVPLAAQFTMGARPGWRIYGAVHLENNVRLEEYLGL